MESWIADDPLTSTRQRIGRCICSLKWSRPDHNHLLECFSLWWSCLRIREISPYSYSGKGADLRVTPVFVAENLIFVQELIKLIESSESAIKLKFIESSCCQWKHGYPWWSGMRCTLYETGPISVWQSVSLWKLSATRQNFSTRVFHNPPSKSSWTKIFAFQNIHFFTVWILKFVRVAAGRIIFVAFCLNRTKHDSMGISCAAWTSYKLLR